MKLETAPSIYLIALDICASDIKFSRNLTLFYRQIENHLSIKSKRL